MTIHESRYCTCLLLVWGLSACADETDETDDADTSAASTGVGPTTDADTGVTMGDTMDGTTSPMGESTAELGPCDFVVDEPSQLLITTTDFSTGSIALADVMDVAVEPDIALGTTDAIPFVEGDQVYVLHRLDGRINVHKPTGALVDEFPIALEGVELPNPQSIAFGPLGLGYVALFGAPQILVFDFDESPASANIDSISVAELGDDGNPEATMTLSCGDVLFVSLQNLADDFTRSGPDQIVAIDLTTRTLMEGSWSTQGDWLKQLRRDPDDSRGLVGLGLTSGLERIDFEAGTSSWVVPQSAFIDAGISDPTNQVQSFDVWGDEIYFSAYADDFTSTSIMKAALDGSGELETVIEGLNAVEKTLEVIGDELWFGDTTVGGSGIRVYDLTQDPPELQGEVLSTGLPPYSIVGVP